MSFLRAFQWYHYHADPIWPDGTFKFEISAFGNSLISKPQVPLIFLVVKQISGLCMRSSQPAANYLERY
jgi:hypothetical protein